MTLIDITKKQCYNIINIFKIYDKAKEVNYKKIVPCIFDTCVGVKYVIFCILSTSIEHCKCEFN